MGDTIERRSLSLQGAQRVLEAAIGQAAQAGLHVSVAVLGSAGQLKAFAAMDGASILSTETARKKALTVIKVGKGTQEFAADLKAKMADEPELFHGMLGAYTVNFAFALWDEQQHAPNEFFRLSSFQRGQEAYGRLLHRLGKR